MPQWSPGEAWKVVPDALLYNAEFVTKKQGNQPEERIPFCSGVLLERTAFKEMFPESSVSQYVLDLTKTAVSPAAIKKFLRLLHAGLSKGNPRKFSVNE